MKFTFEINGKEYSVELSEEAVTALAAIAERSGLTPEAALEQAILNEDFIEKTTESGGQLLVRKGNKLREVVPA